MKKGTQKPTSKIVIKMDGYSYETNSLVNKFVDWYELERCNQGVSIGHIVKFELEKKLQEKVTKTVILELKTNYKEMRGIEEEICKRTNQ